MPITKNSVVKIKTTQEDVYVLEIAEGNATVRRPLGTNDGIKHVVDTFTLGELETTDESRTRELTERFALQQKFASLQGKGDPTDVAPSLS